MIALQLLVVVYLVVGVRVAWSIASEVIDEDTPAQRSQPLWRQLAGHLSGSMALVIFWGPISLWAMLERNRHG